MSLYDLATVTKTYRPAGAAGDDPGDTPQAPEVKSALTKMAKFIPTETITIYLGAISASSALQAAAIWLTPEKVYWITGLIVTPILFSLMWGIDRAKAKKRFFDGFPKWKLTAAIIAFLIWALAIPGNPYVNSDVAKISVAFLALVVSILLDLVDQFVEIRNA